MKRASWFVLAFFLAACGPAGAQIDGNTSDEVPQLLVSSRYVYVTSPDGSEYSRNILPQDRQAIVDVQDEIQRWNHWAVLHDPYQADLIIVVMRRGSEDVMWIYDARLASGTPLWWVGQRGGLDSKELPILRRLESLIDQAKARSQEKR